MKNEIKQKDRRIITLYLDDKLYRDFKNYCFLTKDEKMATVLREMIKKVLKG